VNNQIQIVVCARQILDPDVRLRIDTEVDSIDQRGISHVLNSSDLYAVEEALRIKERFVNATVAIMTLGPPAVSKCLTRGLEMGADVAIRIWQEGLENADGYITSIVLSKAIDKLTFDLILCGAQADDNADPVAPGIAELLDLPVVSNVTHIDISSDKKLVTVHRRLERGDRKIIECRLPAVFTVEKAINEPRYPTVDNRLRALRAEILVWDLAAIGFTPNMLNSLEPMTRLLEVSYPKPRMKKISIPDPDLSVEQRLALLMAGGITEKEKNLLDGAPEEVASKIVKFLIDEKIIS
jgi:electron transfer flavoprotein beta subunit